MRFVHELATPRVVFGSGALGRVGEEVVRLGGSRVLLVASRSRTHERELLERDLGRRLADVVDEVVEHVPIDVAAKAVHRADRCRADLVVSLGGGSATGLAKAIARDRGMAILAIPTTYAGSEMTDIWGVTEGLSKRTGRDERVRPLTVVYDPLLTSYMSVGLTAASGMNALAHCVEAAYASDTSPVVQLAAVEGVRALAAALPGCVARPTNLEARTLALYGAWLSGMALGNASMGIHHKVCHVLGGAHRLPHGGLHSAMLPFSAAFNREAAPEAMSRLAAALGTADVPTGLWDLAQTIGAPTSLSELGFPKEAVEGVARTVAASPPSNPRAVDERGVRTLLNAALEGRRPDAGSQPASRSPGEKQ